MNTLDLLVILDRSGSMQSAKSDHEGGLRSFIDDQRSIGGDVRLTLVQFDTAEPCEIIYDRTTLADVKDVVLIPRGGTPLLDAVGSAVAHLRAQVPAGGNVVVLVITDGEENASTEWTKERVKALVTELEANNWSFLFLGANVDAFAESSSMGMGWVRAMGYSNLAGAGTVAAAYAATASNLMRTRDALDAGMPMAMASSCLSYSDEQRDSAMGDEEPLVTTVTGTFDPARLPK